MLKINIETCHENAVIPEYQNYGDAGMDLVATEKIKDNAFQLWFKTGLKIEIPNGYVGLIYPRSSISKKDLMLANSVGVIDSGFRGEVQVRFNKTGDFHPYRYQVGEIQVRFNKNITEYQVGDRIAQLIILPYPQVSFNEVDSLEDSERGKGGFGSTGN